MKFKNNEEANGLLSYKYRDGILALRIPRFSASVRGDPLRVTAVSFLLLVKQRACDRDPGRRELSGDEIVHHLAVHIRQAEIAAGVAVREFLMVEAQQVQDRRVQVVNVNRI